MQDCKCVVGSNVVSTCVCLFVCLFCLFVCMIQSALVDLVAILEYERKKTLGSALKSMIKTSRISDHDSWYQSNHVEL